MAGTAIDLVNSYYQTAQGYYKTLTEWKLKAADAFALVKELQRQVAFHQANGDEPNAVTASIRLTAAYNQDSEAKINVVKFQKLYDDAELLYQEKKGALLSSTEAEQLKAKQDADTAAINAGAAKSIEETAKLAQQTAAQKVKADLEAQGATFAAKNKQLFLYVGIGLTLLVVGVVVYLKVTTKARP